MTHITDVIIIISLFASFGLIHSVMAADQFKIKVLELFGNKIAFYRLFYNLTSLFLFYLIYYLSPKPDVIIYDLSYPYDLLVYALQLLSLIGFLTAVLRLDGREFIGISQIARWLKGEYKSEELDEHSGLITGGMYRFSRHPVYLFAILFLGLRPAMDLFYLVAFLCITAYFYIGSVYEERKLLKKFGGAYLNYMQNVPRIIPFKLGK